MCQLRNSFEKMAGEEDVELRDLVAQSLEAKGVLGKIRAQLRANVFLALEEQESKEKPHPFVGEKLLNFQKTKEGRQAVAIVREFLQFFELDFTTAVFDPETNACDSYPGREQLARELGVDQHSDTPLLSSLLRHPHTPPSHSFPFTSLHSPSHHLPSHMATFPTSLTSHHHTSPHSSHITNGNSLPPLSLLSDPAHLRPHHHQVSTVVESVSTAISSTAPPTSEVAMVNTSIDTTTSGGLPLPSTTSLAQKDFLTLTASQSLTNKQVCENTGAQGDGSSGGKGREDKGATTTSAARGELDDFFRTQPPSTVLPPTKQDESDSSISDLEDDSMASGKTTDVTQTEQSLHGDYDYETQIVPQEQ